MKESIFFTDLDSLADGRYKEFTSKLVPNIPSESILGVRIPMLRKFAKEVYKTKADNIEKFFKDLPHSYFDENNLHGLLISEERDFKKVITYLEDFLPYVDNWACCDIISPKIFKKHTSELIPYIRQWMNSNHEYTVRFGIEMLMTYFLDENFKTEYLQWVLKVQENTDIHDKYYVKMMMAWYFATALCKQYKETVNILEKGLLNTWTHNMTIQKARESNRISPEIKEYLKLLKK